MDRRSIKLHKSLFFKIGIVILLLEIIILSLLGMSYTSNFNNAVDARVESNVKLPGILMNEGLLSFDSIQNEQTMKEIIGEEFLDGILIGITGNIFYSLNQEYLGQNISTIPEIDSTIFSINRFDGKQHLIINEASSVICVSLLYAADGITPTFFVYVEVGNSVAILQKNQNFFVFTLGSFFTLVLTFAVIYASFRYFVFTPLNNTVDIVNQIQNGNLNARIKTNISEDEIGKLQIGVNLMAQKLLDLRESLEVTIEERTAQLNRQNEVLVGINKILREGLVYETETEVGNVCLAIAIKLTKSKFGFIGLINKEGFFDTIALSNPGWEACHIATSTSENIIRNMDIRGIWGNVIKSGEYLIENNPASHHDLIGIADGHPPLTSFLGVPLRRGDKIVGMIALANKEEGYNLADQETIDTLISAFDSALKRTQMEREVIKTEKLAVLGRLAGGVAHELRNPLGAIKNSVFFLNMVLKDPDEKVKQTLKILDDEVNGSEKIIKSLFDYTRIKQLTLRKTDVNALVRKITTQFNIPDNIEIVDELDNAISIIIADPDKVTQVIKNLLSNAIQAMLEGGQLTLKSSKVEDDKVLISVTDTGVGISTENMKKMFEPLFTTKTRGIGLGLATSKTIIEMHNGKIEFVSQEGKGSTFTVVLPVKQKEVY